MVLRPKWPGIRQERVERVSRGVAAEVRVAWGGLSTRAVDGAKREGGAGEAPTGLGSEGLAKGFREVRQWCWGYRMREGWMGRAKSPYGLAGEEAGSAAALRIPPGLKTKEGRGVCGCSISDWLAGSPRTLHLISD